MDENKDRFARFFETSAKTGENVSHLFETAAKTLYYVNRDHLEDFLGENDRGDYGTSFALARPKD